MVPFESPSRVERRAAKIWRRAANPRVNCFRHSVRRWQPTPCAIGREAWTSRFRRVAGAQGHANNAPGRPGRCVRLVVVDSIAFHVRANTELTYAKRLQLVGQMAQLLSHAARRAHRASSCSSTRRPRAPTRCSALVGWRPRWARRGRTCATCRLSLEWCDGVRLAALSEGRGPGEAQFAVTADGIRSADPSTKLLRPPRPVEAALAPPRLQRWPDAGCRCSPLRRWAATAFSSRWRTARSRCTSKRAPAAAPSRTCSHSSSHDQASV